MEKIVLPIPDEEISVRTLNFLNTNNIKTLNDLALFTKKALLNRRGCGRTMINELREVLAKYGLAFWDEVVIHDLETLHKYTIELPGLLNEIKSSLDRIDKKLSQALGQLHFIETYNPKLPYNDSRNFKDFHCKEGLESVQEKFEDEL